MRTADRRPRRLTGATSPVSLAALLVSLAALPASLTACGTSAGGTSKVGGVPLVREGRLTVCTQLPYRPFEFAEKDGDIVGFEMDLLDLVAAELGVRREVIDTPFETIKTGAELNAGRCDVGANGMTITAERRKNIDFSVPYLEATQTLLGNAGVTARSLDEIKSARLRLGSLASTTGEEYAVARGLDPRSYDLADALVNGLRTGDVDVVIMDSPVVADWLRDPKGLNARVLAQVPTGEQYGFAFRKRKSAKLVQVTNQAIQQAKATQTYERIYNRWIGRPRGRP